MLLTDPEVWYQAMGTYTLSQQETAAIVAAAAPAYWPWPSGDNQRGHPFATRVPVRQIFDEVCGTRAPFPFRLNSH